jgi:hypothetical protein
MSNPLFIPQFKGSINEEAIHEVAELLKSERILTIKDVSFGTYFNGLLRKLGNEPQETTYFEKGQEVFSKAAVLFMPVFVDELSLNGDQEVQRKDLDDFLEKDVIYLFKDLGYTIRNVQIPKKLSNYFDYGK